MLRKILIAAVTLLAGVAVAQAGFQTTASYGVFATDNSGVNGQVQFSAEEGHTRVAVTLTGITRGGQFLPVLFEGTCGPDREMVAAFNPVGSFTNDPFGSVTDWHGLTVQQLAGGQYFLMIFRGADMPAENERGYLSLDNLVACGQVGLGA